MYFDLDIQSGISQILPNVSTKTWGINQPFLGVTLRANKGDSVHVNVTNSLHKTTTLHWHGVKLPAKADGGPHQPIKPSAKWLSEFDIIQPAASLWYHSHQMHETGEQVYKGLAGMFIIDDENSQSLNLPSEYGVDDFPVIIQDKDFNQDGSMQYLSSMRDSMMGKKGATILVNGVINPVLKAKRSLIRLRILNSSNARIYQLQFDDNRPFKIIASDGGLLEKPITSKKFTIAPAERVEIVVDVADGSMPILKHHANHDSMSGMGGRGMMNEKKEFNIFQIDGSQAALSTATVVEKLSVHATYSREVAVQERLMTLQMNMGPQLMAAALFGSKDLLTINDKSMDMQRIDEVVKAGTVEVWTIKNDSMHAHPFHIHNVQFKVISREGGIKGHELGYKDVVLVHPDETVEVIMKFPNFSDANTPYMYHCHILEHEDRGMMGQFVVV
ncbi:MAG TPA: copper oxidase [Gammaproteobacteria bacterium]|nr:copper oxidase [Gammaproteobacteria bacterium]